MRVFGFNVSLYCDNEWKQLEVLWNREIQYNWYSFTLVSFSWSFSREKSREELEKRIGPRMRLTDFPRVYGEVTAGLLGLNFVLSASKYWSDDQ